MLVSYPIVRSPIILVLPFVLTTLNTSYGSSGLSSEPKSPLLTTSDCASDRLMFVILTHSEEAPAGFNLKRSPGSTTAVNSPTFKFVSVAFRGDGKIYVAATSLPRPNILSPSGCSTNAVPSCALTTSTKYGASKLGSFIVNRTSLLTNQYWFAPTPCGLLRNNL